MAESKRADAKKGDDKAKAERKPRARKAEPSAGARAATKAAPKDAEKPRTRSRRRPAAKKEEPKAAAKPATRRREKPEKPASAPVVRARARYLRVAPRKARLVADQIRGLGIDEARALLDFSPRSAARDLRKLLDSAAANAENNHDLVADDLRIADVRVDEGPTLRRYRARALGRATRIDKRTSHVSVSLTPGEEG